MAPGSELGAAASDQLVTGAAPVVVTAGVADVGVGAGVVGAGVVGGGAVVDGGAVADGVVGSTVGVTDGETRVVGFGVACHTADGTIRVRPGAGVGAAVRDGGLLAALLVYDEGFRDGDPSRSDGVTSWLFTVGDP